MADTADDGRMTPELEHEVFSRRWFYRFALPDGRTTPCALPPTSSRSTRREGR